MSIKIMKVATIAALLMVALPKSGAAYQVVLEFVVCVSSVIVSWEAGRARKYIWLIVFALIAILFNPIVPVALYRKTFIWLDLVCILMILTSLAVLHVAPRLSMPSITNRTPGSESL